LKIKSVIEFLERLQDHHPNNMYRGQAREEWKLLPSIARININKLPTNYTSGWRGIEYDLLNRFKKHAIRYMDRVPKNKIEWMIHAQHHGVPTRLLDWSTNPLKALFFAVENPIHDNNDGVVYLFHPTAQRMTSEGLGEEKELVVTAFQSAFINSRIAAQEGCFTIFPFANSEEEDSFFRGEDGFQPQNDIASMEIIVIDASSKASIRKQLNNLGVSDSILFPDLDGVAKDIRRQFGCL
jgi:hypothetical protein